MTDHAVAPPSHELDPAVADLAERFRRALEPPPHAGLDVSQESVRQRLEEPLPLVGMPLAHVLGELDERTSSGLPGTTGPRYFGYVTGGVLPSAAIAQAWATAVDQNLGLWTLSPAGAALEDVALHWLAELLEFPAASGTFTSGATLANTVSLAVARHAVAKRLGVDVARDGVGALPPLGVYGSEELHVSDYKALRTLGLGSSCVRAIPIDERYAMQADLLAEAIERDRDAGVQPAIVIAQAGSVNTGASDPLVQIAGICEQHALWLHVDGAFGAFFRLCSRTAPLVDGLERADSLAVDGHKWLNLPNGTGFALFRDGELHREALAGGAPYLTRVRGAGDDPHERSLEASRPWRGVAAWAALKELGRDGVAELVTRCCELTAELAALVEASPRLELAAPAPTCVCCFRYRPEGWPDGDELNQLNRAIQAEVAAEGEVFWTGAELAGRFCQRVCIVNWRTRSEDVAAVVDAAERAGARLAG